MGTFQVLTLDVAKSVQSNGATYTEPFGHLNTTRVFYSEFEIKQETLFNEFVTKIM